MKRSREDEVDTEENPVKQQKIEPTENTEQEISNPQILNQVNDSATTVEIPVESQPTETQNNTNTTQTVNAEIQPNLTTQVPNEVQVELVQDEKISLENHPKDDIKDEVKPMGISDDQNSEENTNVENNISTETKVTENQGENQGTGIDSHNRQVKFENALDFLDQVKVQFARQPKVYNKFLDIMKDFKAQLIDTPGVIHRVKQLFAGHRSLILGFNTFLPPGYKIELDEEENVQGPPGVEVRLQPELNRARNYVKKIKTRFVNQPHVYKSFLEISHNYHKEQHSIKEVYDQVAKLFREHPDLLEEFTQFLPDPVAQNQLGRKTRPARNVKRDVGVSLRGNKRNSAQKATDLIKRQSNNEDVAVGGGNYEELTFFNKVKQEVGNSKYYYEFLKCLNLFSQEIISKGELITLVRDLFSARHPNLFEWFKQFIGYDENIDQIVGNKRSNFPGEIDYSTCRRYGPSYRALPKNFVPPRCSGRTDLCKEVLNESWVSVPTGSEDYGFKNTRKNQYEEELFRCEDERFELDLIVELNCSAIRGLDPLLKNLQSDPEGNHKYKLDLHLSVLHIRAIERIYGERGPEIIEAMYTNPLVAIPVILARLKQKDQEWTSTRKNCNKAWREVFEKNYVRSLDHQSFHFKQNEKKTLSTKVLLAEVKQKFQEAEREKVTQKRKSDGDDIIQSHLTYNLSDSGILQDITELIHFAAEKILNKVDRERVDSFLNGFLKDYLFVQIEPESDSHSNLKNNNEENQEENLQGNQENTSIPNVSSPTVESNNDTETKKLPSSRLFFANSTFYYFFKLYQILYFRLQKAKEMAVADEGAKVSPKKFGILAGASPDEEKPLIPADPEEKYQLFLKKLYALKAGSLESNSYEDDCRSIFGISSYILFTLDKLIFQLTRQIQSIFSSDVSSRLLTLYTYECNRELGFMEDIYYANTIELLGEGEKCFQFELELCPHPSHLHITLLDHSYQPTAKFLEVKKEKWTRYVKKFLDSDSSLDGKNHNVFLSRNAKPNKNNDKIMQDTEIKNGLDCRILINSDYRLYYINNTEDYLYRNKKLSKGKQVSEKKKASPMDFQQFIAEKLKSPVMENQVDNNNLNIDNNVHTSNNTDVVDVPM